MNIIEFQMKALFIKTTLTKNVANISMPRYDYEQKIIVPTAP
jgi:hypothetical protein